MQQLIEQTGPLVWVLAVFSVYGLGVVAERLFYFHTIKIKSSDLLQGIARLAMRQQYAEALHEASRVAGPSARVIEAALARPELSREELRGVTHEASWLEVGRIERNIRALLVIATVAPMVGMLGTVLAVMQFYTQQSGVQALGGIEAGRGVMSALAATALGLAISIPAYLFYMFLAAKARKAIFELHRVGIEITNIICEARNQRHKQVEK